MPEAEPGFAVDPQTAGIRATVNQAFGHMPDGCGERIRSARSFSIPKPGNTAHRTGRLLAAELAQQVLRLSALREHLLVGQHVAQNYQRLIPPAGSRECLREMKTDIAPIQMKGS